MTLAWQLAKRGFSVDLYEKTGRLGGMIQTLEGPFGFFETAANGLLLTSNVDELLKEIDADFVETKKESRKRYIFREKPRRWPLRILESVHLLGAALFHLFTGKKYLRPRPQETVKNWGLRNWTSAATEFILAPALQGIYAGDISRMSASLLFSRFFSQSPQPKKSKSSYRGLVSGRRGMNDIMQALERKIRQQGVHVYTNIDMKLSEIETPVILATGLAGAQQMLKEDHPQLATILSTIETAPVVTVTTFWEKKPVQFLGFGLLVPLRYGFRALGVLRNSFIFPERDRHHSETFIFGGPQGSDILDCSDTELVNIVCQERKALLTDDSPLLHAHVTRWPIGLPQYNLNLEKLLQDLSLPANIYLHGNYLGGIGLTKILDRSIWLAEELVKKHG